jgi:polyhydroxybutyrate depolymerase
MVRAMRRLASLLSLILSAGLVGLVGCGSPASAPPAEAGLNPPDGAPGSDAASGLDASAACAGFTTPAQDATVTLTTGGRDRTYRVHVPASYDPQRPTPLVLDIHGLTMDGAWQASLSKMDAAADAGGFIAVYPDGTGVPRGFNAGDCCLPASASGVDDVAFIRALLDDVATRMCVDPARVFATGFSNGGFLSHRLGCELADRIAAIAPVAGVMGVDPCTPSRPVPVLEFHGVLDPIEPYAGSPLASVRSVATTVADWASRDGCAATTTVTYQHGDAKCETHGGCSGGAEVTLCTISDGGHQWPGGVAYPGGGLVSADIAATDVIWAFFQAHPRP